MAPALQPAQPVLTDPAGSVHSTANGAAAAVTELIAPVLPAPSGLPPVPPPPVAQPTVTPPLTLPTLTPPAASQPPAPVTAQPPHHVQPLPANPAVTATAQLSQIAPALATALSTDEPASEPPALSASPDEPSTAASPVLTLKTLPDATAIAPADPIAPLLSPGTPREAEPEAWSSGGTDTRGQRVDRGASMGVPAGSAAAVASVPSLTAHRAGGLTVPQHHAAHTTIAASRTLEPAPVFVSLSET
ncbi:MAG TPA: hypothetical protein VFD32_06670, partial [Dehalococcoidia bacterium]|nr:hypothetical protein [Dehalococcoidia bacterium]